MTGRSGGRAARAARSVFNGPWRGFYRIFEGLGARPLGLLVFGASVVLLAYLETSSLGSIRADAVAHAQTVDHPAKVASFITGVYVQPGDSVEVGAPLVELSPHFIDRELSRIDAEIQKLLHESKLSQARLLVEEQRWLTPSMRMRPDRPSLEKPTEASSGRVARVGAMGSSVAATSSVAAIVPEYADEIVAFVPADTDPVSIAAGTPVRMSRCPRSCRTDGSVLRRGAAVEEAPNQLTSFFRFPVHGLPVYISVPPACRLGVGQLLKVEFPRSVF
jgi:multidrug efflux pump subunit AcrA (membrane-fusion protein)